MPNRSPQPYLAVLLLLSACATIPASTPVPAPLRPKPLALFCSATATEVAFKGLNVPAGEEPVDVALTPLYVWLLFQPARLVRIDRAKPLGTERHAATKLGPPGEVWTGLDSDPVQGSVWVVSEDFVFHDISPDLSMTTVPLGRKVLGKSGFARLLVASDALYAAPICGDYGVWRIDRTGKVLGTAFPIEHAPGEVLDPDTMECAHAQIERDREGRILARDKSGKVFRVDTSGVWEPFETDLLRAAPEHAVRATQFGKQGRPGEYEYAAGYLESLFFWKGRPVFLGSPDPEATRLKLPTTFYLTDTAADAGAVKRLPAQCGSELILDVATDGTGYAAITQNHLFFGDFANAPDLP